MKWHQRNEYYWARECGRYFVDRAFSTGRWVHLAWFKRDPFDRNCVAECISPKARVSFQAAVTDCTVHIASQLHPRQSAA